MGKFNSKLTNLFIVIFVFFCYNLKSQIIDNKLQTLNNNQLENYSPLDWTGQGMFRNYKPSDEIIEKRSRSSKHFRNADGTITALIAPGTSLNYQENDSWHSITREIEQNISSEYTHSPYANTHNAFKSYYPSSGGSDGIYTVLKEGTINEWVKPSMYYVVNNEKVNLQTINDANIQVNQDEIIYKNIFNNIDIKFIQNNDGRKMDIILNNSNALINAPANATDLVFEENIRLPENWTTEEEKGCINVFDESNLWIARYEKPVFFDSKNDTSKISDNRIFGIYSITNENNNFIISVLIPIHWLKENNREFPIFIDPTVTIYPNNTTYYTGTVTRTGTSPNYSYSKLNDTLKQINGFNNKGFMKFDISSISPASIVNSATVNYYVFNPSTPFNVYYYQLLIDPVISIDSSIWNYTGTSLCSVMCNSTSSQWYNISFWSVELPNIYNRRNVPGWVAYLNYGFTGLYNVLGYSSTYKPYLSVTYTICTTPGTPVSLNVTLTSQTSANLQWSPGSPTGSPTVNFYWEVYTSGGVYVTGNHTSTNTTSVSNLIAGTTFFFRVRSRTTCDSSYSAWDTSAYFTTCGTPGIPTNLNSVVTSTTSANISWSAGNPHGTPTLRYYWEVYTTGGVYVTGNNTTSTSTPVTGLTTGTSYYFRIQANTTCDNTWSAWANSSNFVTLTSNCITPGMPASLTSSVTGQTTVNLSWSAGTPAGSPIVAYWWEVLTTGGANVTSSYSISTSASVTGLTCGTMYYYIVEALTTCDSSYSAYATSSDFTTNSCCSTPGTPVNLSTSVTGLTTATIQWAAGTPAGTPTVTYYWEVYTTGGTFVTSNNTTSLFGSITSLTCQTSYYFRVRAYTNCGTGSYSSWINSSNFVTSSCQMLVPSSGSNSYTTCSGHIYDFGGPTSNYSNNWDGYSVIYPNDITKAVQISGTYSVEQYYDYIYIYNGAGITGTLLATFNGLNGTTPAVTSLGANVPLTIRFSSDVSVTYSGFDFTVSCVTPCTYPSPPSSVSSDIYNYCSGNSGGVNLSASGLSGNSVLWYSGSCGGVYIGSGNPQNIMPIQYSLYGTTYYAAANNSGCTSTSCKSVAITVSSPPVAPTSISVDTSGFCSNFTGNITLSSSGGSGLYINWYSGSCGGTIIGTGKSLIIPAPTTTTLYYNSWITSSCPNSACLSIQVTVNPVSVSPISVTSDRNNYCSNAGGNVTLTVSGGSGTSVDWYRISCGGTYSGTGNPFIITAPVTSTKYYVRWESVCGASTCISITITVLPLPTAPVSLSSNINNFCSNIGGNINLSASSGTGTTLAWYTVSCGNTTIGTGKTLTLNVPTITSTYYVRWQNTCGNSGCKSIIVTVYTAPSPPISLISDRNNFCSGAGGNISLTVSGGVGTTTGWYIMGCSFASIGTGNPFVTVAPTTTTTYWANMESPSCTNSSCISITITVMANLPAPLSCISNRNNFCSDDTGKVYLSVSGGTGTTVGWYVLGCGFALIGTGNPYSTPLPSTTTTYWANWQSPSCANSGCASITINIFPAPVSPASAQTDRTNFCANDTGNIVLSVSGGLGNTISWYTGSCIGTNIGTGNNFSIQSPTTTTTYWVCWEITGCSNSQCVSVTASVLPLPSLVGPINGSINVCSGSQQLYTATYFSGVNYSWTVPNSWTGTSISNSIILTVGGVSGNITVVPSNACGNGASSSIYVIVNTTSSPPLSVTATPATECPGNPSVLNVTGGVLGIGANWYWYIGLCGNSLIGTATATTQTPSVTTIYFVRAESSCNTTSCLSVTINVYTLSVAPNAFANPSFICPGNTSTLTFTGGTLGNLGTWYWYSGSCGGTLINSGTSSIQSPTITSIYYVRAEGLCNTTNCASVTITITQGSLAATSATAFIPVTCSGSSDSLAVSGGSLAVGANWYWYSGTCGGTLIGTGIKTSLNPSVTNIYFVRAEGSCNTTTCVSVTITISPAPIAPVVATSNRNNFCSNTGGNIILTSSGGSGSTIVWYKTSCGGTLVGTGNPKTITAPVQTTTYWSMWQTQGCTNSTCASIIVTVLVSPTTPVVYSSINSFCSNFGGTITFTGSGGTGTTFSWYTGSCGGTKIGTGRSFIITPPTTTTVYWGRLETATCGNTVCKSITLTVLPVPISPVSVVSDTNNLCSNSNFNISLTSSGGSGSVLEWYNGSCNGNLAGTGNPFITISPTISTVYFTNWQSGSCGNSTCLSIGINIITISQQPTSVNSNPSIICSGSTSTLSETGGVLGIGSSWLWYSGSCGGVFAGSGSVLTQNPSITTIYYLRAIGLCNISNCLSVTITVTPNSTIPSFLSAAPSNICSGNSSTLSETGGILVSGASWYWYSGSCGGSLVGTGSSVNRSPSISTVYFVRAESSCNTSICMSISLSVVSSLSLPTVSANPSWICNTTLSNLVGNSSGNSIRWWTASSGGTLLGSSLNGANFTVSPTSTTTYYAETYITLINSQTFNYTGSNVNWNVPSGITSIIIDASGAQGGSTSTGTGGLGGRVQVTLNVISGQLLYIYAGGEGSLSSGGWNGGAIGGLSPAGGGGGGASDIRIGGTDMTNRVIVAGGGGGAGTDVGDNGGAGGGLTGANGVYNGTYYAQYCGAGGSQTAGGAGSTGGGGSGTLGNGGIGINSGGGGGGGGGGYFGGGGGSWDAGGGGSSWVIPTGSSGIIHTQGYNLSNGQIIISWYIMSCVSLRASVTVIVASPVNPVNVTSTPSSITCSNSSTLNAASASVITWWDAPTGGNILGTGSYFVVTLTSSTSYYAEANSYVLNSQTFNYSGSNTSWTVPNGIFSLSVDARGAQGGSTSSGTGGSGGRVQAELNVTPGQILIVYVGGQGTLPTGGWNGGANGGASPAGGGGGGASDIRIGGTDLTNRIVVSGGGGGAGTDVGDNGGAGGGLTGANGVYNGGYNPTWCGAGGSQTAGGAGSTGGGGTGILGIGGIGINNGGGGGGGGGGYFGGGGGSWDAGGGGSSWITSTDSSNIIHTQGYNTGNGVVIFSWNSILCSSPNRVSTTVTVTALPSPVNVIATPSSICLGTNSNLSASTTNGIIRWWNLSSGGIMLGTSLSGGMFYVIPTIQTTYYAEAYYNPCLSSRVSITVSVNTNSISANSINSNSPVCSGALTSLAVNGGSLGSGANWHWFSGGCGVTAEGTGTSIVETPIFTTTYYVRAEGTCNTTNCISVIITMLANSVSATSINASSSGVCSGSSGTLTPTGGILGNGANWYWYSGTCGGTYNGIGSSLVVSPVTATVYYVRAEGTCNTTSCVSFTITINTVSTSAASVTANPSTICEGLSTTLNLTGGNLGTGSNWYWYSGICGGTLSGAGATIIKNPILTTIYYLRAEGSCNTTSCISLLVNVNNLPLQPGSISGNINPSTGNVETYSVTNVPGITYTWSAPSGWIGSSTSNSITYIVGDTTGVLIVTPYNFCGAGPSNSISIGGFRINGHFTYDNSYSTPLDSAWVYLMQNGNNLDSIQTNLAGYYEFNSLSNGTYIITATTHKIWSGVNSTDAVKVKRDFAGSELFTTSIQLHAADVNLSFNINTTDAVKITRRFVGSDTSFSRGDWIFEKPLGGDTINVSNDYNDTVIVNGNSITQDFLGLCVGDVNLSNVPLTGAKSESKVHFDYNDIMRLNSNENFEISLKTINYINISAISLILKFPKDLVAINDVQLADENNSNLFYKVIGDELRIGWFETSRILYLLNNETLITIKGKTTENFNAGDIIKFGIVENQLCEIADENGESLNNVILNISSIEHVNNLSIYNYTNNTGNDLFINPNPANDLININYKIAKDGFVKISLYNSLGEKLSDVVNSYFISGSYNSIIDISKLSSGIYTLKMLSDKSNVIIKRLIISK